MKIDKRKKSYRTNLKYGEKYAAFAEHSAKFYAVLFDAKNEITEQSNTLQGFYPQTPDKIDTSITMLRELARVSLELADQIGAA